jgi:hypothetical protein
MKGGKPPLIEAISATVFCFNSNPKTNQKPQWLLMKPVQLWLLWEERLQLQ